MTRRPDSIVTPPDTTEMAGRLARVREQMDQHGLDAYVACDPYNVFYLTNFYNYVHERPFILVVLPTGPLHFIAPKLEEPHITVRAVGDVKVARYFEYPAPRGDAWSDQLTKLLPSTATVGVESVCPLHIAGNVPGMQTTADIIEDVRMTKSDYEIGRIAHASRIIEAGHTELHRMAVPGQMAIAAFGNTTRLMTGMMLKDMPNANMLATQFAAVIQPPSISHDPHNFTDVFVELEQGGPHVSVINCRVNGYGAELERTFFLNTVPEAARRPFATMMEARQIAFDRLRPGADMAEIDQTVRDHFEKSGYLENLLHRTGHSFGVTGHEAPFLAVGYERTVEPRMLFSIEPGIYIPGLGGFRHSDTVLVTEDGNVNLTPAPDQLEDLVYERSA